MLIDPDAFHIRQFQQVVLCGFLHAFRHRLAFDHGKDACLLLRCMAWLVVFSVSLKAFDIGINLTECLFFPDRLHAGRIQFYPIQRLRGRRTPEKVESAVIIYKEIGIPERKGSVKCLISIRKRIGGAIVDTLVMAGCAEIKIIATNADIRCIVVDWQMGRCK